MRRCTDRRIMTQSITLEEPDGGGEFAFNMMPPWKHTHDVAFNLMPPQGGTQLTQPQPPLEKSHHQAGQKRRRPGSSDHSSEHFFHNNREAAGNDNNTSSSFANGFGIFPFRASPAAAAATASVLFQSNNNAEFRNHHRSSLESAEVATAQAMANFQALIDQSRSSSGFLAYNSSQRQHSIPSFRNQHQQQQQQQQQQQEPPEQQQHSQPIHIFQKESNLVFAKEALQSNQAFSNSHSNLGYAAMETLLQGFSNSQSNHGYAKESLQSHQGFSNSHSNVHGYAKESLQSNQGFSNSQSNVYGYAKEHQVFSSFEVPTQTTSSAFNFFGDGMFQDSTTPHSSFGRETYSQNSSAYFGNMAPGVHDASISLGLGGPAAQTPGAFGDRAGNYSGFRDPNSSTVSLGLGGPAINGTYRTSMSLDFGHTTTESVSAFHRTTESENGAYRTTRSENGGYHTTRSENGAYHTATGSENGAYHTTESVNGRSGVATGNFHDTSLELGSPWPKLNCQTTTTSERDYPALFEPESPCTPRDDRDTPRDYPALFEPESPCTPRDDRDTPAAVLSEAQEEYLQHIERLNAEFDSPPPQRGRRIPYPNEEAPPAEHNYSIFHPFEAQKQQQHLHIYFDESGMPQQFEEEDDLPVAVAEAAVSETRDLFEDCFPAASIAQEECFEVPAVVVVSEKESSRSIADQFDLNEVPVITVGEATGTPPSSKPRKKYHPRVAKDKRTYKRKVNVDGKKSSHAVDANTNSSPKSKSVSKKRGSGGGGQQQQPTTQTQLYDEEGRDSSYPEVVDMEIEDMSTIIAGVPPTTTTTTVTPQQHDTAICDCESCIKLRLDSRRTTTAPEEETLRRLSSPVSPPDSSSNTQRTLLFEETTPEARIEPEQAAMVLAKDSSHARSLFGSCLQQFNESTALLGYSDCSTTPSTTITSSFMSRLCPRGILSPQKVSFRDMNPIQRVLYLKSILSSTSMSPESLLRHVHDHLPEGEKQQFESSLWPSILKPLTEDQTKQLEHYANADTPNSPAVKRKPGPKPKKVKELAMMLWPGVMIKPVKPRKSTKKDAGEHGCSSLQMVPYEKSNGIVVNESSSNGTGVMVPYEGGGQKGLVAYEGPFNPLSRKRKPRAKVVLDHETVRVWKLLMGKTASGTENVTDSAENEMKWEEERRKMKNRALLFIDRMHIVQGDRSFSCWKGSVVDSVVGAFLTQNVNDVLSSSAFMSMRSRFPGRGFRKTPQQQPSEPSEEEETVVAQSFSESPSSQTSSIAPPPTSCSTITTILEDSTVDHPLTTLTTRLRLSAESTTVTSTDLVESQESRNDSIDTVAKNINQEESSEEVVNQPDGMGMMNQLIVCEENSGGLEYTGSSGDKELVVVDSLKENGMVVEHDPALGKYNPKTGLTGLERAQIEEKQVTARKSFDFSGLQDEFRPRLAGEERPKAPPRTEMTQDGVDWEAVRAANVQEVADVIKERGLNWILAGRIKAFLERIHLDYGDLDLEWLRSMSTDQTKEFLLSIRGLGLKSVECIRLLTLHHLAFPVDTNVGRICVRLGWVPLEPLPEELQLHLLELYPVQATIQKYLWPRLCKLDQQTLYELHYQMITFGKVFCTKSKPNCNACPMRPECKHFASALSSAKLALPPSERPNNGPTLALPPGTSPSPPQTHIPDPPRPVSQYCQPIVEEPMTPESEADMEEFDMEDYPFTVEELDPDLNPDLLSPDLNPDINICLQDRNLRNLNMRITEPALPGPVSEVSFMEDWGGLATSGTGGVGLQESCGSIKIVESVCEEVVLGDSSVGENNSASEVLIHPGGGGASSNEMVLVGPGSASIPVPKLKNVGRLRTVHYVYELPDNHPLLDGLDPREHDDPCTYLLAIWSPGEIPESIPNMNDTGDEENPFAAASSEGQESIKATLLVPCRTAMRGSFPLNGTYFQVNEVFADHASSLQPMIVPRTLLWNLRRRFVFFGTSVTSIFRGMTVEEIQACFWRGYVCVRGFDLVTRAPKPLVGRLHLQAGKASEKKASNAND